MPYLQTVLVWAIRVMMYAIFGSVIISWLRQFRVNIPYGNPLVRAIEEVAELMLRPIRRSIPTAGGGLDFSPVVAIMILYILEIVVVRF